MSRILIVMVVSFLVACTEPETASNTVASNSPETSSRVLDYGLPLIAPNTGAAALYRQIVSLTDAADFIEANQAARQLVAFTPEWSGAWTALANTAQSGEQFTRASNRAKALSVNGTQAEQLWADINLGFVTNDPQAGIEAGKQLLTTYPSSARAALILSGLYAGQNQTDQARVMGEKAILLDGEWATAQSNMGNSYLFSEPKDYEKAEQYFTRAIALAPKSDNLWINVGDVYRAAGRLDQAVSAYSKALKLDAENSIAAVKRAHVNSFLGHYDTARADYDLGIGTGKEGNRGTLPVYRAFINLHAGEPSTAAEELNRLVREIDDLDMPEDQKIATQIFALTNVADICFHFSMNDCSSNAVAGLQTLLTTSGSNSNDPDFERRQKATAMYWQGKLAARTAEYETARKKAEEFKRLLEPDNNPRKLERYHELLGLTALLAKEYDKSIDHYRQSNLSLSAGAGDVKNSYMLARALQATGQNEEAAERLGKVANWNFNSVWFAMLRKNALQEASLASSGAE